MKPVLSLSLELFNLIFLSLLFFSHLFRSEHRVWANKLLTAALFCTIYSSILLFLIDSRLILEVPHLYRTGNIFMYLSFPLGYLYVTYTLNQKRWQKIDLLHLTPTLLYIIDYLPFFVLDGASKQAMIQADISGNTLYLYQQGALFPNGFHFVFRTLLFSIYCVFMFRAIFLSVRSNPVFVAENKSLLLWLTVWTSFLAINCFPFLPFLFFKVPFNLTVVANTLAATSVMVFAIYLFIRPDILYGVRGIWVYPPKEDEAAPSNLVVVTPEENARSKEEDNASVQVLQETKAFQKPQLAVLQELPATHVEAEQKKTYLREDMVQKIGLQVTEYMEKEKPFLQKRFSISDLSAAVKVPGHQLSAYLNNHLGTSFSDFVNEKRINHLLQEVSKKPDLARYTLEALALQVGFNNRFTFLNAFKKFTGTNPSEYFKIKRNTDK